MLDKLNQYSDLIDYINELNAERDSEKDAILTAEQRETIAEIDTAYNQRILEISKQTNELLAELKSFVLDYQETMRGRKHQLVYSKGRVTWDAKLLEYMSNDYPDILLAKSVGKPYVSIKENN